MSTVSPRRWVECGVLGVPTTVEGVGGWKEEGGWACVGGLPPHRVRLRVLMVVARVAPFGLWRRTAASRESFTPVIPLDSTAGARVSLGGGAPSWTCHGPAEPHSGMMASADAQAVPRDRSFRADESDGGMREGTCSVRRCSREGRHLSYLHLPLTDAARRTWQNRRRQTEPPSESFDEATVVSRLEVCARIPPQPWLRFQTLPVWRRLVDHHPACSECSRAPRARVVPPWVHA